MPDKQDLPVRVSPLLMVNGDFIVDYKSVRLSERKALTAIQVLTFNGKHADAAAAITTALGIECSILPGIVNSDGKTQVCWNGPNSWMVVCSDAEAGRTPGELFKTLQDAVGDLGAVVDETASDRGIPGVVAGAAKAVARIRFGLEWAALDQMSRIEEFDVPLLLLHGTEDEVAPIETADAFASALPGLVLYERFEGAERVELWNQDPERYNDAVVSFLEELLVGSAQPS